MYYAQIDTDRIVFAVTDTSGEHERADMIQIDSLDSTLLGKRHNANTTEFETIAQPLGPQLCTKHAFQERFPKMPNGISTKYDAMCMFLSSDSYAASIGVTGDAMHELRMLITTGTQRISASPYVDLSPIGAAAGLTGLLSQPSIPEQFRLSTAERDTMLNTPLADVERYRG